MDDDLNVKDRLNARDNLKNVNNDRINPRQEPSILSKIREFNHHAFNSIGTLFSHQTSYQDPHETRFDEDDGNVDDHDVWDPASELFGSYFQDQRDLGTRRALDETRQGTSGLRCSDPSAFSIIDTPTASRPATPRNRTFDVKSLVHNFSRTSSFGRNNEPLRTSDNVTSEDNQGILLRDLSSNRPSYYAPHKQDPQFVSSSSSTTIAASYSHSSTGASSDDTPPLSPDDSFLGTCPSALSQELLDDHEVRPHSEEIREGKKPERAICYDTLIDDLAGDSNSTIYSQTHDAGEWYGLEYTLELSCKERRVSETNSYDGSVGESSRSRESWAALRRGAIHPFFEDEDYYQWKNWHRYLDHEDEKRKHRKGFEFKARSKDLAWLYLSEMRMREIMYWQLEVYGMVGNDVRERIAGLTEHRRDPYYPPKEHNLGWYLKRSRSISCLRELVPKPTPNLISSRPHRDPEC